MAKIGRPKTDKKQLTLYVSYELQRMLKIGAARLGVSMSDLAEQAITNFFGAELLKEEEPKKPNLD